MIPYGRQDVRPEDIEKVVAVLRSDFLTQGPAVPAFEEALKRVSGSNHAVAMSSATAALHVACRALDVGPGDRVWTSPITFVASANCALYCGASPDFVDIDIETFNMSPALLEERLIEASKQGRLPKVVIPVDLCGRPCDMKAIKTLADRFGFRTVRDSSHAVGGRYHSEPIGAGEDADITVFSFHPVKVVTTGEGGAAVTAHADLAEKMRSLRSHGVTRDPDLMDGPSDGGWYYQQIDLGYNYRLTDIQAALGCAQLTRLDEYVTMRNRLAARYDELLSGLPLVTPTPLPDGDRSARHLYVVLLSEDCREGARGLLYDQLRADGIGVNVHYIPVHTQPYYRALGFGPGCCLVAEEYYRRAITIPLFPTMTEDQQDSVVEAMSAALAAIS